MHGMINCRHIVGKIKFLWSIDKFQNNSNKKTSVRCSYPGQGSW